ncbi:MAG: 2-hydroxyhepta-2,4-diene-1,7-dioate isomerase [Deltaproteobacteria bacterium]|nr:MAG: 2-hydroxyhepta-2,4-diene-1,7-dioate isomerase [Deltaproteobacteria bacterium]
MKVGRALTRDGSVKWCEYAGERAYELDLETRQRRGEINASAFLAPVRPTKIVAVGLNYKDHAMEFSLDIPEEPIIFLKPPSSVIGNNEDIVYPEGVKRLDFEAELAIVISRRCRAVSRDKAKDYILGYTCFNDVTARDLQEKDGQWTRSKSFDTFAPIGPWVETEIADPGELRIVSRLNGKVMQSSSTSNMIFDVYYLVSFISCVMTLEQFDVVATGTPPGVGPMKIGDTIGIEIQGIGELRNRVIAPCTSRAT